MSRYYLLWAAGRDNPGFVAKITRVLFELRCNLEDSSMMRLGSEFAMFVIFTAARSVSERNFSALREESGMSLGLRQISRREARFTPARNTYIIRVHGEDHPGIVFRVTQCLADHAFNITDLSTHRIVSGRRPGYVLLVEGEALKKRKVEPLKARLGRLARELKTKISIEPLLSEPL